MLRGKHIAASLAAVVLACVAGTAAADAVKYRQSVMKSVGGHMGALNHIARGNVPHTGHLLAHATALEASLGMAPEAFKEKSMEGETNVTEEIWSDWAGFESKANDATQAAAAVVRAVETSGDVAAALKELGATCGGCHKAYREKN